MFKIIWLYVLLLIIELNVGLGAASARSLQVHTLPCQSYVVFVDPEDQYAKDFLPDHGTELRKWQDWQKRLISRAFCEIQQKAPILITRACNGRKLYLVQYRKADDLADTYTLYIGCSPDLCNSPRICQCLAHELVHTIDTEQILSDSFAWSRLIEPYLKHFQAEM